MDCTNPHCDRTDDHRVEGCDTIAQCNTCGYCLNRQGSIARLAGETVG